MESEFEKLLLNLRPSEQLFAMAKKMFRELWDHRLLKRKKESSSLEKELKKMNRQVDSILDRIVEADNQTVITAYEKRIKDLEAEKIILSEKIVRCGTVLPDFDKTFRTAFEFLANPCLLWHSDRLADKRTVLKLVFADKLPYVRGEGFRTASIALPFRVLEGLRGGRYEMARPERVELPTAWFVARYSIQLSYGRIAFVP